MKKLISICLAAIISIGLVPIYASAAQSGYASPPAKDGYTLAPLQYSASGIDVSSAFILTTPANTTADQLNGTLTIDGQPMPVIKQNTSREFIVTPLVTLASNSLYIFRLARSAASDGGPDITWAFQTAVKFQITSSFPRNEATNVPRNCGIEITFSCEDFSKIDEFFSISPNVAGRYEYHKDTAVFVPRALSYSTVYTVTLKAGVTLKGTGEKLLDDYVFSFETEPAPDYVPPPSYDSISFHSGYGELPSIEPPMIGYLAYHRGPEQRPDPTVAVYKFNSTDQAISAAKTLAWLPSWSSYAKYDSLLDVNTLSKIAAFEISDIASNSYSGYMVLPDKLQPGFYLVEATYGASRDQMVIQINDLPVQVIADGTKSLIWVNDIATGKGAAGASVYDQIDGKTYRTDANGVATIDRVVKNNKDERFDITSPNGKTCIWLNAPSYVYIPIYSSYGGGYQISPGSANEAYRTAMQLDRTLFKSDDTLSFFGFVQDRNDKEHIDSVTAIMTEAYRFYSSRDILYTQTVPVVDGIYSDEIELPNLDAGYYCLTIYHGSIALNSTYFSVQDYVKPPYKIDVSADKKAVFADDTITFAVKAGFFEGTPVSDLDVSYRITSNFGALESPIYSQAKTDIDGMVDTTVTVVPRSTAQGMSSITFTAEATLPEIGRTTKSVSVRSFINDIDINAKTSRIGKDASISVDVNSITLDRLNNGTAKDYYDYLDKPIAQKTINVEIYRAYYVKFKSGDYYDFIEKKVLPRYFYSLETEKIDSFSIATDEDGHAEKDFTVPNRDFEGYYANITCIDGNGRTMSYRLYIGHDYSSYYNNADTNELYLDGTETSYAVGDAINLTLKRGVDEVVRGNFLYVTLMRGIKSYQAGKNRYESIFTTDYIPNATVYLYYFNGFNYQSGYYGMRAPLRYDYSAGNLTLTAVTDKESYKPGDMCTITIEAKDADGNAKPADINISIVDEALFALRNYTVDTLASVYRSVSTGLRFSASTHRGYLPSLEMLEYVEYSIDEDVPMMSLPTTGSDEDDTYLREIFKDTAYFETMRSNAQGTATYTFKLPDNITSWRLTVSAIGSPSSGSITYAGNTVQNIIVTNPMFINYTLNDEFLAGDAPTIGVNVYGTSLAGGETVTFEVWDEKMPEKKQTASGVAFERVNIPLWEMTDEGANALIIKATVSNGTSDAIKHQYQV
ncbi:MAG: Ig-like domain-containing protein, partial [Oscillospiraceae bacterium]|nr:Ig-like domain-containing protein [Oscillospiraceae bacterium]